MLAQAFILEQPFFLVGKETLRNGQTNGQGGGGGGVEEKEIGFVVMQGEEHETKAM